MKKYLIVGLLVAVLAIVGCAKEAEARGPKKDPCETPLASILNECLVVEHPANPSEDKELMPIGVGLDLILIESDIEGITYVITAEYKYDIMNSEQSVYGVLTLKLQDIIDKIKGEK